MTRFERCWVYILVILAAVSNLLVLAAAKPRQAPALRAAVDISEGPSEAGTPPGGGVCAGAALPSRSNLMKGVPDANQRSVCGGEQASAGAGRREPAEPEPMQPVMQSAVFTTYAYCACEKCCGKWAQYGLTASGTAPQQGRTVAVDPDVIPLGSELWIDGKGPFVAEDTGSGINGSTIDVFHRSHADALEWGKREVTVTWHE